MASKQDLPNFSLPGTGKTLTALNAAKLVGANSGLILCPRIALSMWQETIEDFFGVKARILRTGNDAIGPEPFIVTTYDLAPKLAAKLTERFDDKVQVLINDESHYIKSVTAQRTKAVFGSMCESRLGGLATHFDQVWNMTGTPITAFADDMWSQVGLFHQDAFKQYGTSYTAFKRGFTFSQLKSFHPRMPKAPKIVANTNERLLHKIVYEDIGAIRRQALDGLPALRTREFLVPVSLPLVAKASLRDMTPEKIIVALNDPDSIVSKIRKLEGTIKVPYVGEYVVEAARSSPVLLGVWHNDVGAAYEAFFKKAGLRAVRVYGGTNTNLHDSIRHDFNAGKTDVLIGQMQAMGVSWNIQKASAHVCIAEDHPSPSIIEQFYKRVYRYGQENPVQLDLFISNTLIGHSIKQVREAKHGSQRRINDGK